MTEPPGPDEVGALTVALADRYDVVRQLGRGGMATVYLAVDARHRRQIALKVLLPEIASALGSERFLREIEVAARLNHPNILPLYDSGAAAGRLFYTMPYIEGPSLRQRLQSEPRLTPEEAVQITAHVAAALDYAHGQGVIHRDIKPENILIHQGVAMVTDFGIAHVVNLLTRDADTTAERLTRAGTVVGTLPYMSPEQAMGVVELDARSDIYSLGCVLHEMLAGEPPSGRGAAAAIRRLSGEATPATPLGGGLPRLDVVLRRALAVRPADRFDSMTRFALALRSAVSVPQADRSVAVLPFLNLSPDPENEYFADGVTEDVIAHLTKIPSLKVISRTSVMLFKKREQGLRQIAATLGVTTVLDGSVRRSGNRVRIVAQLVDAQTDQHLWSETYDRHLTDIFAIQTDVALQIAAALRAELSSEDRARIRKEPTLDLHAYQLYLRGRHCLQRFTHEGLRGSIVYFERALERDSGYALAYASMAYAYAELAELGFLEPDEALRHARDAAERALGLDRDLAEAHTMLAQIKILSDFDWAGAERGFKRALELSPGSADTYELYGRMCGSLERYDEAVALAQRSHELDPLAPHADFTTLLLRAGRDEEALAAAIRAVEINPDYDRAQATLGWAYLKNGRTEQGLDALRTAMSLSPGSTAWLAQFGEACALVGRTEEARQILLRLEDRARASYVSPYHFAYVHTGLGEYDEAIRLLERAYDERAGAVHGLKGSFLFRPLRTHPRFLALLGKMNMRE